MKGREKDLNPLKCVANCLVEIVTMLAGHLGGPLWSDAIEGREPRAENVHGFIHQRLSEQRPDAPGKRLRTAGIVAYRRAATFTIIGDFTTW